MKKDRNEIISLIRNYFFDTFLLGFSKDDFPNNRSFYDVGILNSIGMIDVVTYIEENFNIIFDNSEIVPENIKSIDNIADFILKKQKKINLDM